MRKGLEVVKYLTVHKLRAAHQRCRSKSNGAKEVSQKFPELAICVGMIQNIKVKKRKRTNQNSQEENL
jgi:hypothetical protein